jgi:4-hydroxy-4-methyl-2-oxoglutarate aldolase
MTNDVLAPEWSGVSTAEVSDALDRLGLSGQLHGISQLVPRVRMCGRAFTVEYAPAGDPPSTVGDFLDDVPEGAVIALANGGRTDCTVWGGIMSRVARRRRIAGTVVDGAARDTQTATDIGYPLCARARYMRTGKDRVEVRSVDVPTILAGVTIHPGDVVLGDLDGVVVVSSRREAEVLAVAQSIRDTEARIVEATDGGSSLATARRATGYHSLQRAR